VLEQIGACWDIATQINLREVLFTFIFLNVLRTQMSKHMYYTRANARS